MPSRGPTRTNRWPGSVQSRRALPREGGVFRRFLDGFRYR
jgi:hypothetical protein